MRSLFVLALAVMVMGAIPAAIDARAEESPWFGRTVVVTGANRGLGLELARQLHEAGAVVIGTARKPEQADALAKLGVRIVPLDVADSASVAALAETLGELKIDALLNNAGIFPQRSDFEDTDPELALRVFAVNTVGPLRVTQALLPALRRGEGKLIMNMSSGLGSIADNSRGTGVDYRASKAALNMISRTLAAELREEGFVVVSMSPGWVRTDMGGQSAKLSPEESVTGILNTLAGLKPGDSGRFFNHDGRELAW